MVKVNAFPGMGEGKGLLLIPELLHPYLTTGSDDWWDRSFLSTTGLLGQKVWPHPCQQMNWDRIWHSETLLCWEWHHLQQRQIPKLWHCGVAYPLSLYFCNVSCPWQNTENRWTRLVPEAHPPAERKKVQPWLLFEKQNMVSYELVQWLFKQLYLFCSLLP